MVNSYKYYRYKGFSFRVEQDAKGQSIDFWILQSNGTWLPLGAGWDALMTQGIPVSEKKAFLLSGTKRIQKPVDSKAVA